MCKCEYNYETNEVYECDECEEDRQYEFDKEVEFLNDVITEYITIDNCAQEQVQKLRRLIKNGELISVIENYKGE